MEASRIPRISPEEADGATAGGALPRLLRRWAADLPEEDRRRGFALLAAERLEDVEGRLGPLLAKPLHEHGLEPLARRVERDPLATLAGAIVAGWVARRLFRD